MHLAIVRQEFRPGGSAERAIERVLTALLERNVGVCLYTRSWPRTRLELVEPVICNPFHAGALWRDWSFARAASSAIVRSTPSLVESHEQTVCCDVFRARDGVYAARLEERLKHASPAVRTALRISPHGKYLLAAEKRLYANPWLRAVICGSKMVKDEIRERFGLPESKLFVIPNPVDSEVNHPQLRAGRARVLAHYRIAPEATVFLLVAQRRDQLGVKEAIEAVSMLPAPAHLIVVGGDPRRAMLHRERSENPSAGRVTFAGAERELRPYYGAADVLLAPTAYDPSPALVHRAMACGLPVIASPKSGAVELLREHDAGFVCPLGDAPLLARQMGALTEEATRARMSVRARRAVAPFSPSAITLLEVLLYRDLLSGAAAAKAQSCAGVLGLAAPAPRAPPLSV